VGGVGNRTVSWIRHADTHLLTAGRYTYTSDMRFRAIHKDMSEDYLLQILPVQAGDSGVYECQVSTSPVMSHQVILNVEGGEPAITENIGNITRALGQEARLKCVVTGLSRGHRVGWVRIDRQEILTIGRHVVTHNPRVNIIHDSPHTWTLHIKDVQAEDRGYYMCQVNTDPMISQTGHLDVVVSPTASLSLLENISELLLMILSSFV